MFEVKKQLRQMRLGKSQSLDKQLTIEAAETRYSAALKDLQEAQQEADFDREENLQVLAEKRAKQWRMQARNALKVLLRGRKIKKIFCKNHTNDEE